MVLYKQYHTGDLAEATILVPLISATLNPDLYVLFGTQLSWAAKKYGLNIKWLMDTVFFGHGCMDGALPPPALFAAGCNKSSGCLCELMRLQGGATAAIAMEWVE